MRSRLLRFDKRILVLFCVVFFMLLSITTLLTTSARTNNSSFDTIEADGIGYYIYLPSIFIHHDLTMEWARPLRVPPPNVPDSYIYVRVYKVGEWNGISPFKAGKYLDKYPIGVAVLCLPFFLAAQAIVHFSGHTSIGFSEPYQAVIGCAGAFYAALGCVLIYKVLRRNFSNRISYFTTILLLVGTNLLEYSTQDSSFSHVYSLCLAASILYVIPPWYKNGTYRLSALLSLLIGLTVLVRPTNTLMLLVVLLWNITSRTQLRERVLLLWERRKHLALMLVLALIVYFPQLLYWHYITGKWIYYSYGEAGFSNLRDPQIIKILFSVDRGVLFWAPILTLAVLGLVFVRRHLKEWAAPLYVLLPIFLYLMASWGSWQFGESYGHRAFIDIFPLLALCLATVCARARSHIAKRAITVFAALCVFANLFLLYQYWTLGLPSSGTTWPVYLKVWHLGLKSIATMGFSYGLLGLVAVVSLFVGPLTYYFLTNEEPVRQEHRTLSPTLTSSESWYRLLAQSIRKFGTETWEVPGL